MASEEEKADEAAAKQLEAIYGSDAAIREAAGRGDVPALRHFLRVAPERVHEKTSGFGFTPLHYAADNGHVAAAELLLAKGAAVVATDRDGKTPLHQAAYMGRVEVAELLLSKGAAVDAKTNDGKTPLDRARDGRETKMEQLLLNPPAKKASADDGKMPPEMKLLSTAADKTSEADKKAQQTPGFAFSSPPRQTSKEEPAAAAEECKVPVADKASEEVKKAAQELKKAMESANVKALKEAIDKAKLHKVSQEELMEAMDKYIALRESADQAALSPAQEAARELKKAMESANVKALKEAIDKAKLHKVSQEEVMEAMDKYIALRESADPAAPLKPLEAAPSEADQAVRLDSGRGARLAMFSARFNAKNKDTEMKFRAVHKLLLENQYEVLMVDAGAGKSFGDKTLEYLRRLGEEKGVMLAVCTSDYGEMTDSPFCTYYELKVAKEYNVDVLPLQVEDDWKPKPPCGEGHLDHSKSALSYIHAVFLPSIVRIDCRNKTVEEIAREIAAALRKPA